MLVYEFEYDRLFDHLTSSLNFIWKLPNLYMQYLRSLTGKTINAYARHGKVIRVRCLALVGLVTVARIDVQ